MLYYNSYNIDDLDINKYAIRSNYIFFTYVIKFT